MAEDLVSIVIPVYNVKKYLEQCVHSVVNQSYPDLEIILVDDGSTDGSGELCEELSQKDNRVSFYHKSNGGLSSARNYGMDRSKGKYIYFLDSDDYIEEDAIEILVKNMIESNTDFITFCGQCFTDDEDTGEEVPILNNAYKKEENYDICSGPLLFSNLKKNKEYYPAVPMHFYAADFLTNNLLKFKEGILHEDELFSILAYYNAGNAGCISNRLYHRRVRSNSIMTEKVDMRNVSSCNEILNTLNTLIRKELNNVERYEMIRIAYAHCLWLYFIRYTQLNQEDKAKLSLQYKNIVSELKNRNFYNSREIKACYKRRLLVSLRNNKTIYGIYDFVRRKV